MILFPERTLPNERPMTFIIFSAYYSAAFPDTDYLYLKTDSNPRLQKCSEWEFKAVYVSVGDAKGTHVPLTILQQQRNICYASEHVPSVSRHSSASSRAIQAPFIFNLPIL
jgi:hypothetical protein